MEKIIYKYIFHTELIFFYFLTQPWLQLPWKQAQTSGEQMKNMQKK